MWPVILFALLVTVSCGEDAYQTRDDRAVGPGEPELVVLIDSENGLEAAIAPSQGGELSGLKVRFRGEWVEVLHRARDYTPTEGWRGKAPLLWPATGRSAPGNRLSDGGQPEFAYDWGGQRYPMPMHGFVKEMPWQVESRRAGDDGAELTLSVVDTAVTRESYPFGFRLEVSYRLYAGTLTIGYTVRADSDNSAAMPFSIGNHITFRAPLVEGSDSGQMLFESPSSVEYLKDPPGLPTGESRPLSYADPVRLSEIPNRTAVSLGGYEGTPYMVLTDPQGLAIRMSHSAASVPEEPVILYNVWSDLPNGLFSPEPWVGLQNSLNLQQGLVHLPPGEDWTWRVEVRPEEAPANR